MQRFILALYVEPVGQVGVLKHLEQSPPVVDFKSADEHVPQYPADHVPVVIPGAFSRIQTHVSELLGQGTQYAS